MPNLISAVGYRLEKLHSGMIAYLCDLYREGVTGPLESLFRALDAPLPNLPTPKREWNSVDLAIFDGPASTPFLLIEMKVDQHEHETAKWIDGRKEDGYQERHLC